MKGNGPVLCRLIAIKTQKYHVLLAATNSGTSEIDEMVSKFACQSKPEKSINTGLEPLRCPPAHACVR